MGPIGVRANLVGGQGSTFTGTFYLVDSYGNNINLTGASATLDVRASYGATSPLLSLTSSGGALVLGGTAGTIAVTATAAQMQSLPVTTSSASPTSPGAQPPSAIFVYDLNVTFANGSVLRCFYGTFTVTASVTHS